MDERSEGEWRKTPLWLKVGVDFVEAKEEKVEEKNEEEKEEEQIKEAFPFCRKMSFSGLVSFRSVAT